MSFAPLLAAGPLIVAHAGAAAAAIGLGAVQLLRRKGTWPHRVIGWCWVALLGFVAAGSFGIAGLRQVGPFSWIHLLSLATLVTLAISVAHARAGRVAAHRWTMVGMYVGALIITGLFTLVPGRVMHRVLFG